MTKWINIPLVGFVLSVDIAGGVFTGSVTLRVVGALAVVLSIVVGSILEGFVALVAGGVLGVKFALVVGDTSGALVALVGGGIFVALP